MTILEIDTNTSEGKLLMAAIAFLSTHAFPEKTPDSCLELVEQAAEAMYNGAPAILFPPSDLMTDLKKAINKHGREKDSNTPDFILAAYIQDSLCAFETASRKRENWYGQALKPGMSKADA